MTAKQYLRQLTKLELNIRILSEEIEERRTRLESTAAPVLGDKVQTSPGGDRFADAIVRMADKDLQRRNLVYVYEELRDRIVDQILSMENENQQRVLYERYVRQRSLCDIAEEMAYSYYRICHIHGEALVAFARLYLEVSKQ